MASLFSSIPGFKVSSKAGSKTEEIDLWIESDSDRPPFDRDGPLILIECKNWSAKAGKNEFVQLREKAKDRCGRCTVAFLVSWSRSARTVAEEMRRNLTDHLPSGWVLFFRCQIFSSLLVPAP